MPATVTTRSLVSPSLGQRQTIALLLLTGERFEEFKTLVWPSDSKLCDQTIPLNRRCFVMKLAAQLKHRLESLYQKFAKNLPDHFGEFSVRASDEAVWVIGPLDHYLSCDHPVPKRGTLAHIAFNTMLRKLSEPTYADYTVEISKPLTKEEPTHPTAPITRLARRRRFSELDLDMGSEPISTDRRNRDRKTISTYYSFIICDPAFQPHTLVGFVCYCRKSDSRDAMERMTCSLNLGRYLEKSFHDAHPEVHDGCLFDAGLEDVLDSIESSSVNELYAKRNYREFGRIVNVK